MSKIGRSRKQHKLIDLIECKHCSSCKQWKSLGEFYKSKHSWDGLHNMCKKCGNEKAKLAQRNRAPKRNVERRTKTLFDSSKIKPHIVLQGIKHKHCYKCKKQKTLCEFYKCSRNWDSLADICKVCNQKVCKERYQKQKHSEKYKKGRRESQRRRLVKDPFFRLERNLRNRLYQAVKGKVKHGKTFKLLGCDRSSLVKHIENQFVVGMTWENYGFAWHIDHIKPCAAFDLSQQIEQQTCFHYTNLQPLWAKENLTKSSKFP